MNRWLKGLIPWSLLLVFVLADPLKAKGPSTGYRVTLLPLLTAIGK